MEDPITSSERVARLVTRGNQRKYYRFRPAQFYGGIATADCVGCCLRCIFCWSLNIVTGADTIGRFYPPDLVAEKLVSIARKRRYKRVRISGNEPTLAKDHLLEVIGLIPSDLLFILETNGILIGYDESYAKELARFENLYVRVSLKGTNEREFSRLTGCTSEGFLLQIKAIENLHSAGVRVSPAVMASFSSWKDVDALRLRLATISPGLEDIELEELVLYGGVEERLKVASIDYNFAFRPGGEVCERPPNEPMNHQREKRG